MKSTLQNIIFLAAIFLWFPAFSQLRAYSFPEIDSLRKTADKNIVVFIHTDWCRFCQSMKNTTFRDQEVIKLLNEYFWFADLNAEEKQDIVFNSHTFKYKPTGNNTGVHELAEQLGAINGQVSYPSVCILNASCDILFQDDEFLSSSGFLKVLNAALKIQ